MKKMYIFAALCYFLTASAQLFAQTAPADDEMYYWKVLSKVKVKTTFDPKTQNMSYEPVFGRYIEQLQGKTIKIKGYIIPADLAKGKMTLSAFPFSSCFFCGGAGPETVMEVEASQPIIYRMDKPVELQGKLKLNREDPFRLFYILQDAKYADD
jgi:hypothetical protein